MERAVMAEPISRKTPSTGGSSFKHGPLGAQTARCKGADQNLACCGAVPSIGGYICGVLFRGVRLEWWTKQISIG